MHGTIPACVFFCKKGENYLPRRIQFDHGAPPSGGRQADRIAGRRSCAHLGEAGRRTRGNQGLAVSCQDDGRSSPGCSRSPRSALGTSPPGAPSSMSWTPPSWAEPWEPSAGPSQASCPTPPRRRRRLDASASSSSWRKGACRPSSGGVGGTTARKVSAPAARHQDDGARDGLRRRPDAPVRAALRALHGRVPRRVPRAHGAGAVEPCGSAAPAWRPSWARAGGWSASRCATATERAAAAAAARRS